jgi:hypothetical protein
MLLPALLLACGLSRHADVSTAPEATRTRHVGWGVIAYRRVGVAGARFTLEAARRCKRMPEPVGRDVVLDADAQRAGCRLRPWHGSVSLALRDASGSWIELAPAQSDPDGKLQLRFAELDEVLRTSGAGELADYEALRVGRGGWAGTYDLERLRGLQADVHAAWIGRGRGVPALFGVLYPQHPRARAMSELAIEARLARQEQDFAAIERGELLPSEFLERHVWSPLRVRVAAMLGERTTPEG